MSAPVAQRPLTRRSPTIWETGREPGRAVVALGAAVALSVAVLDVWLVGGVGLFFDLWFGALCIALALRVRPADFFTVGVLPPLLMVGTFVLLAVRDPALLGRHGDGIVQAVTSGLAHHSIALVVGYAASLAVLLTRQRVAR